MSFKERLTLSISNQNNILKLKYLRDYGLDKILADPDIKSKDFNTDDKTNFVTIINDRIVELGGTV